MYLSSLGVNYIWLILLNLLDFLGPICLLDPQPLVPPQSLPTPCRRLSSSYTTWHGISLSKLLLKGLDDIIGNSGQLITYRRWEGATFPFSLPWTVQSMVSLQNPIANILEGRGGAPARRPAASLHCSTVASLAALHLSLLPSHPWFISPFPSLSLLWIKLSNH